MTMKKTHWSVAQAKASLSQVLQEAAAAPQVIERRGTPVAVVVSLDQYRASLGDPADASAMLGRWQAFLRASAAVRASGGGALARTKRVARRSPFGKAR
jgi:prevent-host-death family protein